MAGMDRRIKLGQMALAGRLAAALLLAAVPVEALGAGAAERDTLTPSASRATSWASCCGR